jgi:hypothetical protein
MIINLSQGKTSLVDSEDFDRINNHKWSYHPRKHLEYGRGRVGGKMVYLHRFIMNFPKGKEIDHINGNGLDNRKVNLQSVTHQQNMSKQRVRKDSKSGIKRVWIHKPTLAKGMYTKKGTLRKCWVAELSKNGKKIGLGYFSTKEEALIASMV